MAYAVYNWPDSEGNQYNKFDPWLQRLSNQISVKASLKKSNEAFGAVRYSLLDMMKRVDPLFNMLFRRNDVVYTGSSYEGLKIGSADEFDLNLVLDLPDVGLMVEVSNYPGHAFVKVTKDINVGGLGASMKWLLNLEGAEDKRKSIVAQLQNWTRSGGYFSRSAVIRWLQSVVDRALHQLMSNRETEMWHYVKAVKRSNSGPAITLNVTRKNNETFSVDLVPALSFSSPQLLPPGIQNRLQQMTIRDYAQRWFLIPKGPIGSDDRNWRVSMYGFEKTLINNLQHFKPMVRMIKRLRDAQKWDKLASYYILNIFMWVVANSSSSEQFNVGLGQLLMQGLYLLEKMMRYGKIEYFWDPSLNLLDGGRLNGANIENIAGRIRTVIKDFNKSLTDDSIDPMIYFGSTKNGHVVVPEAATVTPFTSDGSNCSIL